MNNERLVFAAFLAILAGARLLMLAWHVKRGKKWLDDTFGADREHDAIAQRVEMMVAAALAGLALVFLYV